MVDFLISHITCIVCVRLGLDNVDEEYFSGIRKIFDIKQCVGMMGGKKNKALYFVGHEGENLIFLDPHYVTDAVKKSDVDDFDVSSYTCNVPKKLSMRHLDPCLAFGFLAKDSIDFDELIDSLKTLKKEEPNFTIISSI